MKQKSLIEVLREDAGSVDAVLRTIEDLCTQLRTDQIEDWENPTLLEFLEALHAWLETMGPRFGEKPSWKFIETMVRAAKIYE